MSPAGETPRRSRAETGMAQGGGWTWSGRRKREPLHVLEQSGTGREGRSGDPPGLCDVMITLSSHQLLNCSQHVSSSFDAYNSTVVFLKV